ncbi:IS66 family transposase [Methylomicrobium album]|uniref:Transposase n=1 Tax=Methylomicrobium album BG8 TaxID=686340 RepID=H8GLF2_METAL|nr:IS66 family transposase [Methylomicrobium album]EIC29317.1 transposase [Methylomicrobium album BG8]EIC29349.1 transposase [Methylomicrobium album BG8]EIC29456.1 transposase [Methylomicrobium album BG8]EIC30312.1 transposase [Methylomicrobium album BG8]EIC30315.1 transposase [Methylomicrobium album BG8]
MNPLAKLDQLHLEPSAKTEVAALLQALIEQAERDAKAIQSKDIKIAALTHELAYYKRIRFSPKSEALAPLQRDVFEETWNTDISAIEAEVEQLQDASLCATVVRPKRLRAGRQPLPSHLPRIEHRHEPESCTCGHCGRELVKIGEDVTEQLDVEPAKFFVHRHIRPQYACRSCETVTAAPIPPAVIDGGLAAVGLLSWVMISKFQDHLPLYRLEQIAARDGVTLSRSTLADWVGRLGVALQPLSDRLAWQLLQRDSLHADETPVPQLDPGNGKTKKAYLWAYRSNDLQPGPKILVFDYQAGRSGRHAGQFLGDWQGHLVVDDYAGYKALFAAARAHPEDQRLIEPCIELACWAHARRKFFDLLQASQSPIAQEALNRIAVLYAIEAEGRDLTPAERQALRAQKSLPALADLHDWLQRTRIQTAPNSATAKAIDYSLKRWIALSRYAETGDLPIDNNPIENSIRPIALGKKNWLFAGSERAGKRAAVIQTLLGTAKLNGLDPSAWLKDTLEKLPTWPNSRIDELLPLRSID